MKQTLSRDHHSELRFERIWVREAIFRDVLEASEPLPPQSFGDLTVTIEVKVTLVPDQPQALVLLRVSVRPPADRRLFTEVIASVEGAFTLVDSDNRERLDEFASLQAPVLLLPFARSIIANVTNQTRVGSLVLPPINMQQVVSAMRSRGQTEANAEP